jgi:hypothetical protein
MTVHTKVRRRPDSQLARLALTGADSPSKEPMILKWVADALVGTTASAARIARDTVSVRKRPPPAEPPRTTFK